jgi:hypothetical protein
MVRVTSESPPALGGVVATVPDTEVSNGVVGIPAVGGGEVEGVADVGVPEYEVAAAPESWARRAEDVPARWDHPGLRGPATAKAAITSRTAAPATAPPSRQLTERARPAARRHATAAATEPVHTTNTSVAPGRRASDPEPRPWTTAIGQQA